MDEQEKTYLIQINELEKELQEQRGMLWVLGEMMKVAHNISSFEELMKDITDMLMGVTGVSACYLWAFDGPNLKLYFRHTELENKFLIQEVVSLPDSIQNLMATKLFKKEEITHSFIQNRKTIGSRLAVPLMDFATNRSLGILVLEHPQEEFFTENKSVFFEVLGTFIASHTKNSKLLENASRNSEKDPLTGVFNRRYLQRYIGEGTSHTHHITVAIIDADNFKKVNDQQGHLKGDEVLKAIANQAACVLKEVNGQIARYGGDEFVLVVPAPLQEALPILENLKNAIHTIPLLQQLEIPVTVTMGVAAYPEIVELPELLIQKADEALLQAKTDGKNKIRIAR
jgi:diguanylate cyclase (GGDEF)-like protein